jgi:hypothetical protein
MGYLWQSHPLLPFENWLIPPKDVQPPQPLQAAAKALLASRCSVVISRLVLVVLVVLVLVILKISG